MSLDSSTSMSDEELRLAALDQSQVTGLTHGFYRYPARFSPRFAGAVIERFSRPNDLILDPFAGGGTSIIEALIRNRQAVGNDINSLAVFVMRVKTTPLSDGEMNSILLWSDRVSSLRFHDSLIDPRQLFDPRLRNLSATRARSLKKLIALTLEATQTLPSSTAQDFARCAILRTAQWALDGRKRQTTTDDFREMLRASTIHMLEGVRAFMRSTPQRLTKRLILKNRTLIQGSANTLDQHPIFRKGRKVRLVLTSPPYPGVHVLYHRWQVDGRKETPAPYWIAGCEDGAGSSYYTFGSRKERDQNEYFEALLGNLKTIRRLVTSGGTFVQLVAFNNPSTQLERYLITMEQAGFKEMTLPGQSGSREESRLWRTVPNRKWYTSQSRQTGSAREVVLIHTPA